MNSKHAFELLSKQFAPGFDVAAAVTPQSCVAAIALTQASGKSRFGTQGQAAVAMYLRPKGATHEQLMAAFGLKAGDVRMNVIRQLGPVNGKAGTQYRVGAELAETVTSGTNSTLHVKVTPTELGKAAIAAFIEANKPVKAVKADTPTVEPIANEPVALGPSNEAVRELVEAAELEAVD